MSWIDDKFKTIEIMMGSKRSTIPSIIEFKGAELACEILSKSLAEAKLSNENNLKFLIHGDVDVDGVGSAYIMYRFICGYVANTKIGACINKEKVHGVSDVHVNKFNSMTGLSLVIIVDSSSKCINSIKKMECDVIVIDHHNLDGTEELSGNTANGRYVVINNHANNDDSISAMSGAEVVYEFLRYYQSKYCRNRLDILESEHLYQWVAMSLFTDVIDTDNERNQWYIEKAFDIRQSFESNLGIMSKELNNNQNSLDKSFINFTFASLINSTIRGGASSEALDTVFRSPGRIVELKKYKELQDEIVKSQIGIENPQHIEYSTYCMLDMSNNQISKAYCGLIAGKLLGETHKTSIAFKVIEEDGVTKATGSFRGANKGVKYQELIKSIPGCNAEGHSTAFGFVIPVNMLIDVMNYVTQNDIVRNQEMVTLGNLIGIPRGEYHYNSIDELRKDGLLYKIAAVNSRVSSNSAINIVCMNDHNVTFIGNQGKVYLYNVHGLECKAFGEIKSPVVEIYIERRSNIEAYIREKNY